MCWPSVCLLWKNVYSGLPIFKIRLLVFLLLSCMSSLYVLDINFLLDMLFANIFSCSLGCLSVLLMVSFFLSFFLFFFFAVQSSLVWLDPIFFKLEDNYFTILCWFLPYINMSWPQVHTHPLPPEPPSHLPPHPTSHMLLPPERGNQGALSAPGHVLSWPTWPIRYILYFAHHHRGSPLNSLPPCIKDLLLSSFPKVFRHSSLRSHHSLPIAIKLLLTISDTLP